MDKLNIIIIEDNQSDLELIKKTLVKSGFNIEVRSTLDESEFKQFLVDEIPDIILTDYSFPQYSGLKAVEFVKMNYPQIPIVIVTGTLDEETAASSIKSGAWDYVVKERLFRLPSAIKSALKLKEEKSERAKTNARLKESEERIRQIIEASQEWIWEMDVNGMYTFASPIIKKILGYKPEEIVGHKHFYDFFLPEDREELKNAAFELINNKQKFNEFIDRKISKTGKIKWLSTRGIPILNEKGNLIGYRGSDTDITERKLAEDALLENHSRHAAMITNISDVIVIMDADGITKYQSPNIERWFGWKAEDLIGANGLEMVHSEDIEMVQKELINILKKESASTLEFRFKCKDGKYKWIELTAINRINEPAINGLLLNYHDITERKKVEEEKAKIYNSIQTAIYIYDFVKSKNDYINPEYTKLLGWTLDDINKMGNKFTELFHPDDFKQVVKHMQIVSESTEDNTHILEYRFKHKNGQWRWCLSYDTPFQRKVNGDVEKMIGSLIDITERKQVEEALKESEKKHRELIETTSEGFWLLDSNQKIIDVNQSLCDMLGYSRSEMIGKTPFDFVNDENLKILKKQISQITTSLHRTYEIILKMKNGINFPTIFNVTSLIDKKGKPAGSFSFVTDIAEIKQTVEALRTTKERYFNLFNNANDLIQINNPTGKFIAVNKKWMKTLEYSQEEVKNIKVFDIIRKDKLQQMGAMIQKVKERESINFETIFISKSGKEIMVEGNGNGIFKDGKLISMIGIFRDVTERKLTEEVIQKSAETYRITTEKTGQLVYDYNHVTGKIIWAGAIEQITGFSPEEFQLVDINKWTDKIHPDERKLILAKFVEAEKKCSDFDADYQFLQKNGSYICVEHHGIFLPGNDGKVNRMLGSIKDITERKRAEQVQNVLYNISNATNITDNLLDLTTKIREDLGAIIDTTNFYIALYDEKTDMFSMPYRFDEKEDITIFPAGKTLTNYVLKTQKSLLVNKEKVKELIKTGDIHPFPSKSKIWLGIPLKIAEKSIGVIAVQSYEDENAYSKKDMEILEFVSHQVSISIERKKTEQDLKDAFFKATESDRLKTAFLNTMSHELRTPLNAVIGFSDIIDEDLPMDKVVDYNKMINESGKHLLNIIDDIFDISLIESGEMKILKDYYNLAEIFDEVNKIISIEQTKVNRPKVDYRCLTKVKDKDLLVFTDKQKLKQILINLLKNSIKFTHEGYIECNYKKEIIDNVPMLKFWVKDTGIGIPEEKINIIFDIFRQADDSHTRKYDGTGIGLTVSKNFTELLGGKIWVESEKGKGSTFYFTLPKNKPETQEKISSLDIRETKNKFSGKTVLVAEDDLTSYTLLKILLGIMDIKTIHAKNGKESIEMSKNNAEISLVLMDVKMPDMNGYEATAQIKKIRPELIIIAQTSYALQGDNEKALEAGCDDYISKPIKKQKLFELIEKHLV